MGVDRKLGLFVKVRLDVFSLPFILGILETAPFHVSCFALKSEVFSMAKKKQILKRGSWSAQALRVLEERYLQKDKKGRVKETPEEMLWRVADEIAEVDKNYGASKEKVEKLKKDFYLVMIDRSFLPNSPTLMNAGTGNRLQYAACYVLPVEDSISGIFDALKNAAVIHQSGGGTGFSFSRLRPDGSQVRQSGGIASGPVSFMKIFDAATEQIKQGGKRRGANMGILRVDHPEIEKFISCKVTGGITNFNISVGATDTFMKAVVKNKDYQMMKGSKWPERNYGKKSARDIFNKIVESAWKSGDPGMIWLDKINNGPGNPVPSMGPVESTNPCGEQPLYPNEACNLGSINLGVMLKGSRNKKEVDWGKLEMTTKVATRFLDSVIDVNPYPLEEIKKSVMANRRIGLGVMGWADMLFQLQVPYDSAAAVRLAKKVMKAINRAAWSESEKVAEEKGPFPNFKKSIYKDTKPKRNATVTTIAPTGSISIIADCSSGIEPIFALAYTHKTKDRTLCFVNPYFKEAMGGKGSQKVFASVKQIGHLSPSLKTPKKIKDVFKTAHEIHWQWHIKMQAAFQAYTDNAVSKTINLPNSAVKEEVADAYLMAYKLGCIGVTVFRDGCKGEQVLNAGVESEKKEQILPPPAFEVKPRPAVVKGVTYRVETPVGTAFVVVNHNGETDQPLEVFINVGKVGSDIAADAEALGRLISLCLRISSPGLTQKRVSELIVDQLEGIGGGSSVGFGKEKVRSLADGIAKAIRKHIHENGGNNHQVEIVGHQPTLQVFKKRKDICPSCGNATLAFEEGCAKCISCGYSKC